MTRVPLIIGAVLVVVLCGCSSAGDRRADNATSASAAVVSQAQDGEPDIAEGLSSNLPAQPQTAELPPDRDGDQVPDADDQCQESAPGLTVDVSGCAVFSGAIDNLEFAPDGDELNAQAQMALDALITNLNEHPEVVIAVDGHTDNRGQASSNLDLSKRRVIAVVRYLVEQGVPASRLKPYGYGESRPLKSNATP